MESLKQSLFAYHRRAVLVPRAERVSRALAAQIGRAASLLDIGCGDGSVALALAASVGAERVEGVDIKIQPNPLIKATPYDGEHLPFESGAFEAVVLSDVLHHCKRPEVVLREALRVASRVVALKDHFRFGPVSNAILYAMDVVGNAAQGVYSPGTYWSPVEWTAMVRDAGGRITGLDWPLQIHDYPWRVVTQDRLQFAASIEPDRRAPGAGA